MMRELDIFRQIVSSGGFNKAAEPLGLTPGAITQALQRLERELGVTLIQRSTRSFRVTAEGEELFSVIDDGLDRSNKPFLKFRTNRGSLKALSRSVVCKVIICGV